MRKVERPVRLAQRAFEQIRAGLLGEAPEGSALGAGGRGGDRLTEEELARELDMSRTPVREALHRLLLRGLIEPSPGGGYRRRRTTLRGVREHCELRLLLEPHAASLAARRVREGEPDEAALSRLRDLDTARPASHVDFHVAVAEAARSDSLPELIAELNDLAGLDGVDLRYADGIEQRLRGGHAAILAAIEAGDPEAAGSAMTAHLEVVRDAMISALERRQAEAREANREEAA